MSAKTVRLFIAKASLRIGVDPVPNILKYPYNFNAKNRRCSRQNKRDYFLHPED